MSPVQFLGYILAMAAAAFLSVGLLGIVFEWGALATRWPKNWPELIAWYGVFLGAVSAVAISYGTCRR